MRVEQKLWTEASGWQSSTGAINPEEVHLVLIFAGTAILANHDQYKNIKDQYPNAVMVGCSTAGEICDTRVRDDSISLTAISFDQTSVKLAVEKISASANSYACGTMLAKSLNSSDLSHILVISDGLKVNGTELVNGFKDRLPEHIAVTGGLSGDGARFETTLVCANDRVEEGLIAAVGFYGNHLKVGYGSLGGWDPFGPERIITKAQGNVLYELDGQSALQLYKTYLGEHAHGLPSTGLLFPLSLRAPDNKEAGKNAGIVRTILAVNEDDQSMTFAGDLPEGYTAQLMKANFERLIDGASDAAHITQQKLGSAAQLAILISCVGRKLVLKQRIEEEVESVRSVLGNQAVLTGFYSYGEISPHTSTNKCELHNQTMTITTFAEDDG
jgi:hypothetical protein